MGGTFFGRFRCGFPVVFLAAIFFLPHPAFSKQIDKEAPAAVAQSADDLKAGDVAVLPLKAGKVKMTIITANGFVSFTTNKDWRVGVMQSKPPVTQTVFQIPNAADEGTSHSTNLVVSLIAPNSDKAEAAIAHIGKKFGPGAVIEGKRKGWKTWTQEAIRDGAPYSVIDARKNVAGQIAWARIAWPHLKNDPPGYSKKMATAFNALLDSVSGKNEAYPVQPGEIIRRPE